MVLIVVSSIMVVNMLTLCIALFMCDLKADQKHNVALIW